MCATCALCLRLALSADSVVTFAGTGVNAIIMPGRRIGVYSLVGPGVVLYDDLPDRQVLTVKQELTMRPWGPERYGW